MPRNQARAQAFGSREHRELLAGEFRWADEHQAALRTYQHDAVEAVLRSLGLATPALLHAPTGSGKGRMANEIIARHIDGSPGRTQVVCLSKNWRLLYQLARDLRRRYRGYESKIGRIGGDGEILHPLPNDLSRPVLYSTLQSLVRRLGTPTINPSLVVIDECHWAELSRTGRLITYWCQQRGAALIGLTATPRPPERSRYRLAHSVELRGLIEQGYLARPTLLEPVRTEVRWSVRKANCDFTEASLRALGGNRRRNEVIVEHYVKHADSFGPTIIFACSVEHAVLLTEKLSGRGVPARAVYHHQSRSDRAAAIRAFEKGEVRALVNVEILTTGSRLALGQKAQGQKSSQDSDHPLAPRPHRQACPRLAPCT